MLAVALNFLDSIHPLLIELSCCIRLLIPKFHQMCLVHLHSCQCVIFYWLRLRCVSTPSQLWWSRALRSRYTMFLLLPDDGAHSSNSAQSRSSGTGSQTQMQHQNIRLLQNKTLHVEARSFFTELHKQTVIVCRTGPEVNGSEVFRGRSPAWFCNYSEISSSHNSSCPLAVPHSKIHLVGVDGRRSTEQTSSRHTF